MVALTFESATFSARSRVASASLNWPRTLLMPAWRTVKAISLCELSRVQVPVVTLAGSAMVFLLESGGWCLV
ncbi:hypothetical protein D3C85_1792700 [compost metagenome]